ncbi:MAG TPA: hypothetical protein DIW81_16215 [Planctomycetaceae bacterium]|nr:hypothetical protein [Rubinisphaera sp.]HCS53112.1 hypothetical protein [Planctomycetaceae bacterium]
MRLFQLASRQMVTVSPGHSRTKSVQVIVSTFMIFALALSCGCANMTEKRTITAFQEGLQAGDVVALREKASDNFEQHALRHPKSNDSLEQLKLPDGEFEILNVEDVTKTDKKVTIGFGEDNRRKIQYRLVKNEVTKKWEVDDIYLRQRSGEKTITMPVTEQMNVLLSSREFYEAWQGSNREQALSYCDDKLAAALAKLPPSVLASQVTRIVGKSDNATKYRPEVHISGDRAFVKLNRPHGKMEVSLIKTNDKWLVNDLGLDSRDSEYNIVSLLKTATIANQAIVFLDAWKANDRATVKEVTDKRFYDAGLETAEFQDMAMPSSIDIDSFVEVKMLEERADVVLNGPDRTIRMTLKNLEDADNEFRVAEVILYDVKQDQTLSLTSALSARPVAMHFVQSLQERDKKMLQFGSTRDLHEKTWNRASTQTLSIVPMPFADLTNVKVEETQFLGSVTHIHMKSDTEKFTVVLHDINGKVLVDDLLVHSQKPGDASNKSLKDHLGPIIPVYELASNIHHNQTNSTLRLVTDDFYDRVFSLSKTMPPSAYEFLKFVSQGNPKVEKVDAEAANNLKALPTGQSIVARHVTAENETIVKFESPTATMLVTLHIEQGLLRVDDAIVSERNSEIAKRLKQSMRMDLASARTQNMIQTVSGEIRTLPDEKTPMQKLQVSQTPLKQLTPSPAQQDQNIVTAYYEESNAPQPSAVKTTSAQVPQEMNLSCQDCQPVPTEEITGSLTPQPEYLLLQPIPTE